MADIDLIRAKNLLKSAKDLYAQDFLREARNIDFYGNVKFGEEKREISREEVNKALETIEDFVKEAEKILEGDE